MKTVIDVYEYFHFTNLRLWKSESIRKSDDEWEEKKAQYLEHSLLVSINVNVNQDIKSIDERTMMNITQLYLYT